MPTYAYRCTLCDNVTDHYVTLAQRLDPQVCPSCEGRADFEFAPPRGEPPQVRERGPIMSERDLPRGWREKGTTGLEGGAGKKLYF